MMLLQLKEARFLSQVAIDDVVRGCDQILEASLNSSKLLVEKRLTEAGITDLDMDDCFEQHSPFSRIRTKHLEANL